jgi:hypothetical protein
VGGAVLQPRRSPKEAQPETWKETMKRPTLKALAIAMRLLHVAGSNPSGDSAKSSIEQTLRPRISGHFSIEHYQVLKSDYAVTPPFGGPDQTAAPRKKSIM